MDEYTVTKMDTIMDLYYLERRKAFQKAPVNGHEEKNTEMKKRKTGNVCEQEWPLFLLIKCSPRSINNSILPIFLHLSNSEFYDEKYGIDYVS